MEENNGLIFNGGYPIHNFEDLESLYDSYISNQNDRDSIKKAYEYILRKHDGQMRKSGEPYYHHLLEVAYILASLQCGPVTIIAGLLHDVVEDTNTPLEEIENGWGKEVAKIVDSLTKIQRLKLSKISKEEFEAEDQRKIFLGMARDVRVIIVKLADRLHNIRTLKYLKRDRQIAISKETIELYAPIAHKLGMYEMKMNLQDGAFKYLYPEEYRNVKKGLKEKFDENKIALEKTKRKILFELRRQRIVANVKIEEKHLFNIYRKMKEKNIKINQIKDLFSIKIITKGKAECYRVLGILNTIYSIIPGNFKDYIAIPRNNMYQAIHEILIR